MSKEHVWSVRVSGTNKDRNLVFARRSQFDVGVPLTFDEEYPCTTALEHFLAAVGSDLVGGLLIRAKRLRVALDDVEATVECVLGNPLTFLDVVGEEGSPGIKVLRAVAYISSLAKEAEIEKLWHTTLLRSPMIQTLQGCVQLELSYKVVL